MSKTLTEPLMKGLLLHLRSRA